MVQGIFKKFLFLVGFISLFLVINEKPSVAYTLINPNSSFTCADNAVAPLTTTKDIQTWLSCNGFNPGPIDGAAGARTTAAVKRFQSANGLSADGVVGPAGEELRELGPLVAQPPLRSTNRALLLRRPGVALYRRVQFVYPPFPTLFP